MQIQSTMTGLLISIFFFAAFQVRAQEPDSRRLQRLKYRYQIEDIDGIGELIGPLFQQVVDGDSQLDSAQQHLIAIAALRFYIRTGEHARGIIPCLIALQIQNQIKEDVSDPSSDGLVQRVRESLCREQLPPVFFSDQDHQRFSAELSMAIERGVLNETDLAAAYRAADPNQLSPIQQNMMAAISTAKEDRPATDREIVRLVDSFVTHQDQHPMLAHESLATAIEALQRLDRQQEADRLQAVFRTNYPDSRRLNR